jgi:hypothetical protein
MHQPWLSQKYGFFLLPWPPSGVELAMAAFMKACIIFSSRSSTDGPETGSNLGPGVEVDSFF